MNKPALLRPKPIGVRKIQPSFDGHPAAPTRRKIGLDLVRAVAISLVLVSHFVASLDILGVHGVELFFALSGFLIGGILYRNLLAAPRWSFAEVKRFWLRRWWRTLPNYYVFLGVFCVFHACVGGLPGLAGGWPFLVFCQDLFGMKSSFFSVSWSLCIEEWFYLLFPVCVLLFTGLGCSKRRAFLCATLLFLVLPAALRERMFAVNDPAAVRLMTFPRLDAIFYGVATAFATARWQMTASVRTALLAVAAAGLVVLTGYQFYCFESDRLVPFYRAAFVLLPLLFSLTLPFFETVEAFPASLAVLATPVTKLSLWSYSIYLSHIPILFLTYAVFGAWREEHAAVNVLSKVAGLAVCIGVSRLVYEHFEVRLTRLRPAEGRHVPSWNNRSRSCSVQRDR